MTDATDGSAAGTPRDPRPAPEYGEYATPEEQARAAGREYHPVPPPPHPSARPVAIPAPAEYRDDDDYSISRVAGLSPGRVFDRSVTIVLLVMGGFFLLNSAFADFDFQHQLSTAISSLGVTFDVPASAQSAGYAIFAANAVLYLLALWLGVSGIRHRRISFWIPVTAAIVYWITAYVIVVAMVPGFFSAVERAALGTSP